ncbi:MAG: peptidylprolyl isomerase [Candidatus Pacearchaeota archaeon]
MIKKGDFVEIEFTAEVKSGEIFDTTDKEIAKKIGLKEEVKPIIFPVGYNFLLKGLEEDIIGKEVGINYSVEISPEKAFGKRNPNLIQKVSIKIFNQNNINPQRGMQFSFDGMIGRIISSSGGRVLVDFNHPLAGKYLVYNYKIIRKIEDIKEKFDSLQQLFFKKTFESEIKDNKIEVKVEKNFFPIFNALKKRFEEILGFNILITQKE